MSAVRITLRAPRSEVAHWLSMTGISALLHLSILGSILFVPQLFHSSVRIPDVYTVDLVALPAGTPGLPAEKGSSSAPAAAPAPAAPPRAEPAVKIPEAPEAKIPKPKLPRKTEPPRPKPDQAPPKAQPKAASPAAPPESPGKKGGEGSPGEAAGTEAGGIPGGTGGSGGGGSGFLDDASFAYGWYLSNMTSILGRNWARPIKPELDRTLRAVVHFRVLKDGSLTDIDLEQPSGDPVLDRSALRAVQDSNPLPPLPYQYGKDSLGVHFFFDLKPE
jgi:TonB family protein